MTSRLEHGLGTVNRQILRAGASITVGNLFVSAANLTRDISVAKSVGTSAMADGLFLAMLLPVFLATVAGDSLRGVVVPYLQKARSLGGPNEFSQRTTALFFQSSFWIAFLVILVGAFAPAFGSFLAWRNPNVSSRDVSEYLLMAVPMFGIVTFAAVLDGPLQILGRNLLPRAARVAPPLGFAIGVMAAPSGVSIGWGFIGGGIGALAQLALAIAIGRRSGALSVHDGCADRMDIDVSLARQFCYLFAACSIAYVGPLIDQWMAGFLEPGAVSKLAYANRIALGFASLTIGAIGPALLPAFGQLIAAGEHQLASQKFIEFAKLALWLGVALTLIIWSSAKPLIGWVFERGTFTASDTAAVADILGWSSLQLLPLMLGTGASALLSATGQNRVFVPITFAVAVTNALGNLVLMQLMGVAGIALATGIAYVISFVLLAVALYQRKYVCVTGSFVLQAVFALCVGITVALVLARFDLTLDRDCTPQQLIAVLASTLVFVIGAGICTRQ